MHLQKQREGRLVGKSQTGRCQICVGAVRTGARTVALDKEEQKMLGLHYRKSDRVEGQSECGGQREGQ